MSIESRVRRGFNWVMFLIGLTAVFSLVLIVLVMNLVPHGEGSTYAISALRILAMVLIFLYAAVLYLCLRESGFVGKGLREASARLEGMMAKVDQSSTDFRAAAAQQASGAAEQAAAVTETTATIEELSRTAQQIATASEETLAAAQEGKDAVRETIEGMDRIKGRVDDVAGRILSLGEKSQRIGEINEIITDITGKTHLLALNAAIESAAAGEFGARFAVVAAQVKELADETREATGQVKGVIREIQNAINASVMATEETTKEVNRGSELSAGAGQVIEEIVERVQSISVATQQQRAASEQGVTAMRDIKEVARQSATSSQDVAAGGAQMAETAASLRDVITQLTHDTSGKKH